MTSPDPRELRHTFETVAREYDRTRPGYPPALFDDLAELAGLRSGSRVLEIGCGTGQATRALAERGYSVVAIELGAELAALARRKLAAFPKVEIEVAAFEGWPLPAEPFDAVIAATAFHWIEPAVRVRKAAEALRHGGALAIIETHHVAGGTRSFFADVQRCYERSGPAGGTFQLPDTAEIAMDSSELDSSGAFEPAVFRRHEWEREYTSRAYTDLLLTYSNHIAQETGARATLMNCIRTLIEREYGGHVIKPYLTQLVLARTRLR